MGCLGGAVPGVLALSNALPNCVHIRAVAAAMPRLPNGAPRSRWHAGLNALKGSRNCMISADGWCRRGLEDQERPAYHFQKSSETECESWVGGCVSGLLPI